MQIKCNGKPRPLLSWYELTDKEQAEFDFTGKQDAEFFRYKGGVYTLGDFSRCPESLTSYGWQGYLSDSFFSGVVLKYAETGDVVVGTFLS